MDITINAPQTESNSNSAKAMSLNNGLIWFICFVPLIGLFLENYANSATAGAFLWILVPLFMIGCSICSTFPFFTIFSTIATVSAAISYPFAQSFCPFAVYKLVLFHFYFIHEKETPFLFRSSVSDICSSSVLSQSRKMMQNSVIPCFVTFRYFLLFGRSHPQSAPSPQSSFRQSCG